VLFLKSACPVCICPSQEYVASLESTTQQQRRQLGLLKEEKRKAEEVSAPWHAAAIAAMRRPADMPSKMVQVPHIPPCAALICAQLLWKQQHAHNRHGGGSGPVLSQFESSEVQELPPRLRALFEDNKAR
jgi:hypothetical protein